MIATQHITDRMISRLVDQILFRLRPYLWLVCGSYLMILLLLVTGLLLVCDHRLRT